ncbi:MAG: hypothetical protein ACREBT_04620 [Thermoplasmata archaeon]
MAASVGAKTRRYWGSFVLALVGVLIFGASFVLSWVHLSANGATGDIWIYNWACVSFSGSTICAAAGSSGATWPLANTVAEYLLFAAIALGVLTFIFAAVGGKSTATVALGGLGFILGISAPLLFLGYSYYSNWIGDGGLFASPQTAGTGWYLAIVGAVFLLIAMLLAWSKGKASTVPPAPAMSAPPGPMTP